MPMANCAGYSNSNSPFTALIRFAVGCLLAVAETPEDSSSLIQLPIRFFCPTRLTEMIRFASERENYRLPTGGFGGFGRREIAPNRRVRIPAGVLRLPESCTLRSTFSTVHNDYRWNGERRHSAWS
jgi:hypothetical protein